MKRYYHEGTYGALDPETQSDFESYFYKHYPLNDRYTEEPFGQPWTFMPDVAVEFDDIPKMVSNYINFIGLEILEELFTSDLRIEYNQDT